MKNLNVLNPQTVQKKKINNKQYKTIEKMLKNPYASEDIKRYLNLVIDNYGSPGYYDDIESILMNMKFLLKRCEENHNICRWPITEILIYTHDEDIRKKFLKYLEDSYFLTPEDIRFINEIYNSEEFCYISSCHLYKNDETNDESDSDNSEHEYSKDSYWDLEFNLDNPSLNDDCDYN